MNRRSSALLTALMILSCVLTACSEKDTGTDSVAEPAEAIAPTDTIDHGFEAPYEAEGMRFSVKSGFYPTGFDLEISAPEGAKIYYTLDGSVPTSKSELYDSPIPVYDRSDDENRLSTRTDIAQPAESAEDFVPRRNIDKATVVRAMMTDKNGIQSHVVSNTYFIGFDEKADYYRNVKVVSLMTDEDSLFGYDNGIYVLGRAYDEWRNGTGYDPETPEWSIPANYTKKGREWERAAAIQFFEEGHPVAAEDVGIRIHGGATRSYSQKSFNVYARKDYGAPKLEYDLFSGNVKRRSDGTPVTSFDSFILRNGGNDAMYTRFRDKLIQSLVSDRQFLTQGMEPCIVFINGEYWGHYEITEKPDSDFISTHYGVPAKDICIIKKEELEDGSGETFAEWEELRKWIKSTDLSQDTAYAELCEKVDMQGFMEYISAEIYVNNADWGKANSIMWKAQTPDSSSPYADGKWRFVMFDTDFSTGIYGRAQADEDSFQKLLETDCFLADLFSSALKNESFRTQFRDTFMDIADNCFAPEISVAETDRLSAEYHDMTTDTYDRFWSGWFGGFSSESSYSDSVGAVREFFGARYDYITEYLGKYV